MIDIVQQLPAIDDPIPSGSSPEYPSFGLPHVSGKMWELRSSWLQTLTYILMDMPQHQVDFGRQAYGLMKGWFYTMLWGSPTVQQTYFYPTVPTSAFEQEKTSRNLLDPLPYIVMFSKPLLLCML